MPSQADTVVIAAWRRLEERASGGPFRVRQWALLMTSGTRSRGTGMEQEVEAAMALVPYIMSLIHTRFTMVPGEVRTGTEVTRVAVCNNAHWRGSAVGYCVSYPEALVLECKSVHTKLLIVSEDFFRHFRPNPVSLTYASCSLSWLRPM